MYIASKCACLETNKVKPDSIRVKECRQSIHENLAAMTKNAREKTLEEMGIYLNKNCKEYLQVMTSSKNTNKGDWETLNTNPILLISFKLLQNLYVYHEMIFKITRFEIS